MKISRILQIIKPRRKRNVVYIASITSIVAGILIIVIAMTYYKYKISQFGLNDKENYKEYTYHYAMISDKADETFWNAIYKGALEKGKEHNIYVEKMGSKLSADYSLYDLMKIAIASKVDGIILEPDGSSSMENLINEADAAGIPVITVLKDVPQSKRKSFIGINSYNEGQAYGNQVLELVNKGKKKVSILLNSNNMDTSENVIYSAILDKVSNRYAEVDTRVVSSLNTFSSEEDIRNIIMNPNPPDVLVCLTAMDTTCAFQAIVDYNKVGQIDIIGYYDSEIILRAIDLKIIHSTMTINARQMGAYCVDAMSEYYKTGRVSDYYSIPISVINQKNIKHYLKVEALNDSQ